LDRACAARTLLSMPAVNLILREGTLGARADELFVIAAGWTFPQPVLGSVGRGFGLLAQVHSPSQTGHISSRSSSSAEGGFTPTPTAV
jgi:hypothetical protein